MPGQVYGSTHRASGHLATKAKQFAFGLAAWTEHEARDPAAHVLECHQRPRADL